MTAAIGSKYPTFPTPSWTGNTFKGWFTEAEDGTRVMVSNSTGYYVVTEQGTTYVSGANDKYFAVTVVLWVILGGVALLLLWLLRWVLSKLRRYLRGENSIRVLLVVMATVVVSGFVAYSLMSELYQKEEDTMIGNIKLFAELMHEQTNAEAILQMKDEGFYGTSSFKKLREPLDEMIWKSYEEQKYYYYDIFTVSEKGVLHVANYDDRVMCCEPYAGQDCSYYEKVIETGNSYALSITDEEGNWLYVLIPVTDKEGVPVAVLEVGTDLSLRNRERTVAIRETALNVVCSTAVVLMLVLEGVLFLGFLENRRRVAGSKDADLPGVVPIRMLIFFTNAADSLQDAFITILCIQLYKGQLPIPESVAVALPLSAQLLALALFSSFMGTMGEKKGASRVMGYGLLVQCAGCLVCVLTGSYFGVLIGKVLIGAGMGTVYVNCYAVAAKGKTQESSAKAFSMITAGCLSGVTIGAGIASVLLTIGGWKVVYVAGALLLMLSVYIAFSAARSEKRLLQREEYVREALEEGDMTPEEGARELQVGGDESIIEQPQTALGFLFQRRIIWYFILMILPAASLATAPTAAPWNTARTRATCTMKAGSQAASRDG